MAKSKIDFSNLPTDVVQLKTLLKTLKDKEAKLECDLALRECPELESGIIRIMMLIVGAKRMKSQLNLLKVQPNSNKQSLEAAERQLVFYQSKVEEADNFSMKRALQFKVDSLTARIESLKKEVESRQKQNTKSDKYDEAVEQIVFEYKKRKPDFDKKNLNLLELIPSLCDYVKE